MPEMIDINDVRIDKRTILKANARRSIEELAQLSESIDRHLEDDEIAEEVQEMIDRLDEMFEIDEVDA